MSVDNIPILDDLYEVVNKYYKIFRSRFHQGGIRFDSHQNRNNRACGDRNLVATGGGLINSEVEAP